MLYIYLGLFLMLSGGLYLVISKNKKSKETSVTVILLNFAGVLSVTLGVLQVFILPVL